MRPLYALFLAALALAAAPTQAQPNTIRYAVESTDGSGQNLDLNIYPATLDGTVYQATTDADGFVRLDGVPAGRYYAYPTPASGINAYLGYEPATTGSDSTSAGEVGELSVARQRSDLGRVRGRITDAATGEPVGLATTVFTASRTGGTTGASYSAYTTVDGDGNYYFTASPGEWTVNLRLALLESSTVYELLAFTVTFEGTEEVQLDLQVTAPGTGAIEGRVVDEAGLAVEGVEIVAHDLTNGQPAIQGVSAPDGRYALPALAGEYLVVVDDARFLREYYEDAFFSSDATPVSVQDDAATTDIDFSLERLSGEPASVTVEGTVVDTDGQPIGGATVTLMLQDFGYVAGSVVAEPDGSFLLAAADTLLAGTSLVARIAADGYVSEFYDDAPSRELATPLLTGATGGAFALGTVDLLAEGEELDGFAVTGSLREDGSNAPVGSAMVAVVRLDDDAVVYTTTSADGTFRADGLDAGAYVVLFAAEDYVPEFYPDASTWTEAQVFDVQTDVSGVNALIGGLNRPVGSVRVGDLGGAFGQVRDEAGGALRGALVAARLADGDLVDFAIAATDGTYALTAPAGATLAVQVDLPRYEVAAREVSIPAASAPDAYHAFTLPRSAAVASEAEPSEALVLHVSPNPLRGASTVAYTLGQASQARLRVLDALGREVALLASGPHAAGPHQARLDASGLATGVYLVVIETEASVATRSVTVIR